MYVVFKTLLSALLIVTASEAGRRNAVIGALVASLPLVSVMAMAWLWIDTHDAPRLAAFSLTTFWYVLPSLPMFLLLSVLLRGGVPFWLALAAGALLTVLLYTAMTVMLARFGITM